MWSVLWLLPSKQTSLLPSKRVYTQSHTHSLTQVHTFMHAHMHRRTPLKATYLEMAFNKQGNWGTERFIFRHKCWGIAGHAGAEPFSGASTARAARVFQATTGIFSFECHLNGIRFLLGHLGFGDCCTNSLFSRALSRATLAEFESWLCCLPATGNQWIPLCLSFPLGIVRTTVISAEASWGGEDNMN